MIVTHVKEPKCILLLDDCKVYKKVEFDANCLVLQKDFANMSNRCKSYLLLLNFNKCSIISFTGKRHRIAFDCSVDAIKVISCGSGCYFW